MCFSTLLLSARNDERHALFLSVDGGYAALLHKSDVQFSPAAGLGAGLGFGYEFRHRQLTASFGLEADFRLSQHKLSFTPIDLQGFDSENEACVFHYTFDPNKSRNAVQYAYFRVPILMGYAQKKWYAKGGLKIGVALSASEKTSLGYNLTASYDRFIDEFGNMPSHNLTDGTLQNESKLTFGLDVAATLEAGAVWQMDKTELRLGGFVDFGFLDINKGGKAAPFVTIESDKTQINGLLSAALGDGRGVNPLFVGAKFTVLFDLTPKSCNCLPKYEGKTRRKQPK